MSRDESLWDVITKAMDQEIRARNGGDYELDFNTVASTLESVAKMYRDMGLMSSARPASKKP